ncbi:MAG: replication initiation protein [Campylobacter sp.]|nr:replication initiation protein [Campylobacter sp.]
METEHTKDGLKISTKELFELADISDGGGHRSKLLKSLGALQEFKFQYSYTHGDDKEALAQEIIFPLLKIFREGKDEFLSVKVSEVFRERYLKAMPQFTRFELEEFVNLSGTYTKTIYRFLKQYKNNGYWRISYKDFKKLLGIPKSYQSCDIDKQILKPAIKELSSELNLFDQRRTPFQNLSVTKHKKGREIEALRFTFMPQPVTMLEKDKRQYERSLNTISNEIKRQGLAREIKRSTPKINILTGEPIDELKIYVGRHFNIKNKFDGGYDTCKIQSLSQDYNGKIYGKAINQENGKIFDLNFESIAH